MSAEELLRVSRRTAQRDATRQRVREAAARLFIERGLDGTQIRDIANAARVSVGTVMNLGDKENLFLDAMEELLTRRALDVLRADQALHVTLQALARTMIPTEAREQHLTSDYLAAYLRRDPDAGKENREHLAEVLDALTHTWQASSTHPITHDQAQQRAREFYGACLGLTYGVVAGVLPAEEAVRILDRLATSAD